MAYSQVNQIINQVMYIALKKNTDQLVKSLARFDYPSFNRQPPAGGWTAGEIAEHLLLFDIRLSEILKGRTVNNGRDPQEKIATIVHRLSDNGSRIEAPSFLAPVTTTKAPKALLEKILAKRSRLIQQCSNQDLNFEYPDTPHRLFGPLTGMEWINVLIYHTNRHLHQLDSIMAQHGRKL